MLNSLLRKYYFSRLVRTLSGLMKISAPGLCDFAPPFFVECCQTGENKTIMKSSSKRLHPSGWLDFTEQFKSLDITFRPRHCAAFLQLGCVCCPAPYSYC